MLLKRFITISLLAALNAGALMPLAAFAEEGSSSDDEILVEGATCNDGSGYVFDVVGSGLTCVEVGTAVPDTDCILTSDGSCEDIGVSDDDDDSDDNSTDDDGTADQGSGDDDVEVTVTSDADSDDDSGDDVDADEESDDDYEDEVFYDEEDVEDGEVEAGAEEEGEVVVEDVEVGDLDEDAVVEFTVSTTEEGAVQTFLLSVRWGYFAEEGEERPDFDVTDWDGTISFQNGTFALPVKMLRFERGQDSIDFSNTTATQTTFQSDIYNATDGLLFKVKTNLEGANENGIENIPSVTFVGTDSFSGGLRVSLDYLIEEGEYRYTEGDYELFFQVWTSEEWVKGEAETQEVEDGVAEDAEQGSWYEAFMNQSIGLGFFGGDRHPDGRPMGTIRPGDGITRFELLKVASELAFRLDMGVGATDCDPRTVEITSSWMGVHWADGYVQCLENSGIDVRLLDDIIAQDVSVGNEKALRMEVAITMLEVLDISPASSSANVFTDSDEMTDEEEDFVNYLVELGVVAGYPDGHFGPDSHVNRAEMFKIVSLLYEALSL